MKLKRILFIAALSFFLAYGNGSAKTFQLKTTHYWEVFVFCDNTGLISGQFDVHYLINIKEVDNRLVMQWAKTMYITGEAVLQATGEVFRVTRIEKSDPFIPGAISQNSFHMNLVGDRGTHMLFALTLEQDWTGDDLTTYIRKLKYVCR